ncbi:MAG: TolC family protein [Bacteroidia bacterium]
MKRLTLLFLFIGTICFSQNATLSLDSCLRLAKKNYPLIKQNNLLEENKINNIKADNKNWLPKTSFITKATYQTEVVEFQGQSFPHDNYVAALDIEQSLVDGGQTKQLKRLDRLNADTETLKNEVELYKLIDRVNQLYGTVLLSRENIKILKLYKEDISNKKIIIAASVNNGIMLQSNLDALEAEELKTEQSLIETKSNLETSYQSLMMFINSRITDSTLFSLQPALSESKGDELNRPELKLFDAQKSLFEVRHKLENKNAMPRISISGEGAYGRPGPNFLDQDLRFFAQAGINIKWNIGALYNFSNQKKQLSINQKMVDVQKEVFEFNIRNAMLTEIAQINSLTEIIEKDKKIIEKRHNISSTYAIQLQNGAITSTDYLTELNAEMQAILNQKVHEIKRMTFITNYNTSKGINNF